VLSSKPHPWVKPPAAPRPDGAASLRWLESMIGQAEGARSAVTPPRPAAAAPGPAAVGSGPSPEAPPPPPGPARRDGALAEEELWERALELFAEERFEEARALFEEMIRSNPRSARAHLGLGFLYANLGVEDRSREHAETARRYDDLVPEIYFLHAILDEKNGEVEQAIANYQRVILLQPDFAIAHFNLGNLYLKLHRHRDARREFGNAAAALSRDPENRSLRFSGGLSREAVIHFCELQRDQIAHALPRKSKGR